MAVTVKVNEVVASPVSGVATLYPYAGGVVRAGEWPQIGDTNRRNIPTACQQVARMLKPIRANYDDAFHSNPDGFTRERTKEWLARFDDEG